MKKIVSLITVLACVITAFAIPVNAVSISKLSGYAYFAPNTPVAVVDQKEIYIEAKYDIVSTGDGIKVGDWTYKAIVLGDTDFNGTVTSTDFMQIRKSYLGIYSLGEIASLAADINCDGKINSTDFIKARRHFLSITPILQGETFILKDSPSATWSKFVMQYKDYAHEVFHDNKGENGKEIKYMSIFNQNKQEFNENYEGVADLENYIDEFSACEYNYLGIEYSDYDTLDGMSTTHIGYMRKYIDLLNKLEFTELSDEERKYYYDSFRTSGENQLSYNVKSGCFYFCGKDDVYEAPTFDIIGNLDDPFANGLTFSYADHTYLVTNYEQVKYEFYEIFAAIYCRNF